MSSSFDTLDPTVDRRVLEAIVAGLLHSGSAVVDQAIPAEVVDALRADLVELDTGGLTRAGIGRGDQRRTADAVRRDRVHWLSPETGASAWYFRWIESLRLGLNRSLYLGLVDHECHFAWYGPGAFYAAHVDAFRGDENRKVSTVLYLNHDWRSVDGGELVLYDAIGAGEVIDAAELVVADTIVPSGARLVCFLSEEVPHEVRVAAADRYSIAGWFSVRKHR